MPTSTYIALANLTLTGTDAEVSFTSIPNTYRDLVVVIDGTVTANAGARMEFNNDTGQNYSWVYIGASTTAFEESAQSQTVFVQGVATLVAGQRFHHIVQIMDYSATDKHKTILSTANENNVSVTARTVGRWASTTAVNRIDVFLSTSTYAQGTTFALYGIVS